MVELQKNGVKMKILITYVEAGNGHKVASQAIADALKEINTNQEFEIIEKNLFETNSRLKKYQDFLIKEVKKASASPIHSNIQLAFMNIFGAQNTLKFVNGFVYKSVRDLYINEIKKIKPDIIIDTHYFCAYCAVTYRNNFDRNCRVITYDPDNNVHGWWDRRVDKFVVNNQYAYKEAIQKHFKENQVERVSFITRKNILETNGTKDFYRKKYNIPQSDFVVKLADGIYGEAKMKSYIYELIKTDKRLSIIAIAGKNEKLYKELQELRTKLPSNISLFPFPFVKEINELIIASDLFITKAGPNAVLDSVYLRVPIVINYYANKIEEATKRIFVDECKCGLYISDKKKCRKYVEECITDRSILNNFIENEKVFDKLKSGGSEIAKIILQQVRELKQRKLKLLLVTETFFPVTGGVQNVVDKSAISLSKYCDVTIATTKHKKYNYPERPYKLLLCKGFYNKITNDGIPFICLDRKFRNQIKNGNFDIIHCHNAGLIYNYALKIGKKYKIPVISTIHNTIYEDAKELVKSKFLAKLITKNFVKRTNKSDFVWKISEFSFNYLKPFGIRQDCQMMRNCVDLIPNESKINEAKEEIVSKYNLKGKTILLNVGRVVKLKNVDWLIDVAKILRDDNNKFVIMVVGDGDYFKEFKKEIEKNNLEKFFVLVGNISSREEISKYYSACDLLLFPSNTREVSPLIPVEAAAFSKPTLAIKGSPAGEMIVDGENGFLCENDANSFAEKTKIIVEKSKNLSGIGKNANDSIYRCYYDPKMIKELLGHYVDNFKEYNKKHKS